MTKPRGVHLGRRRSLAAAQVDHARALIECGESPRAVDLLHRRLQPSRCLHDCSGCSRLGRSPGGAYTHWKAPPSHGAHVKPTLPIAAAHGHVGENSTLGVTPGTAVQTLDCAFTSENPRAPSAALRRFEEGSSWRLASLELSARARALRHLLRVRPPTSTI